MGQGTQACKEIAEGNLGYWRADHQDACPDKTGDGQKSQPTEVEDLAGVVRLVMQKVFPELHNWVDSIPDPRRQLPKPPYPFRMLFFHGLNMFFTLPGTRAQFDFDCKTAAYHRNLLAFAGLNNIEPETPRRVPLAETVDDMWQQLDPCRLNDLRTQMVRALLDAKRLDACHWRGYWRLVADATCVYTFSKRHCPQCQTRKNKQTGEITYFHYVLEFKLVSPSGWAVSIHSEFLLNNDGETKQDCETKAAYRALPIIKNTWPRMRFLLLGDGIYNNAKLMELCEKYGWGYCFSLKDNVPNLHQEAVRRMAPLKPKIHIPEDRVRQELTWVEGLHHSGHLCHAMRCVETKPDSDNVMKTTTFEWITNLRPSLYSPAELTNETGRQRWKIENQGFNTQKNGGYNLEHGYGVTGHAWQNYYLLIQIAHMIMQLIFMTDAIHKLPSRRNAYGRDKPPPLRVVFGTFKNFFKRLAEAFRYCAPTWKCIEELAPFQLRFLNTG